MDNMFIKYLSKYTLFSDKLINIIVANTVIQKFKKGTALLREGDRSNEYYLILEGCMRSYAIKGAIERTIEFYTEGQFVTPPGYGKSILSEIYLECVEDTVATISTPENEFEMFQKFPELKSVCLTVTEEQISNYQNLFIDYKTTSVEKRYLKLIKERPDLIQRVPQYQLASYLGIQPETLSRIRKRISKK
jgi:CRP-like cAMP-binding protein